MPEIRTEELTHIYSAGTPFEKTALEKVSLSIRGGEFVALLGHTGSGKSTLIQHLNGLLSPTSGRVLLDGENIHKNKETLRRARFRVGLVFQYPEYQLFEETVRADIAFGPKNKGLGGEALEEAVLFGARFAGVPESMLDDSPLDCSGGQKRRIAIAGVLAMKPEILILDEPTAGLDPAGCQDILENVRRYRNETGAAVLLVTHNMSTAARMADRLIVMNGGHMAMDGTPAEVFSRVSELVEMGLDVPPAASIAQRLRHAGFSLPRSICTAEELCAAVLALKEGTAC